MALQIGTNPSSLAAQRTLISSQSDLQTSYARLSSGSRINSARDDAAGMAIGNRLQAQAASLAVAQRNAANGISLAETRDAALSTMADLIIRARELHIQSSDGTLNATDKLAVTTEIASIDTQLTALKTSSKFAGVAMFSGSTSAAIKVDGDAGTTVTVALSDVTMTVATDIASADAALTAVNTARAAMGAAASALQGHLENMAAVEQGVSTAAGRVMDTDYARESATLAKNQILQQAGTAILAQANQSTQSVLSLLQ
ncbi:MAG: flagellin [Litorivicinus sp.]